MNNFLLSMIICLNGTSPELKYYEKILREFSINFGYHLQIDGNPFEYKKLENILQICQKLNITDIGLRTNENVTEKNMKLIKKYNIRSIMYKEGNKHLKHNIALAQNYNISTEISVVLSKNNIRIMYFSALSLYYLLFFFKYTRRSRHTYNSKQLEAHRYISISLDVPRKYRKTPPHVYTRPSLRTLTRPCLSLERRV